MQSIEPSLKVAIIGLGYVGLPLADEFGKKCSVMGFDINVKRIAELQAGEYGIGLLTGLPPPSHYDALVLAAGHDEFKTLGIDGLRKLANGRAVIYDIKGLFGKDDVDGRL